MSVDSILEDFSRRDWQTRSTTEDPVRFAMVGLGWWTIDKAIPATETAALCETTTVVSGSEKKANDVATEFDLDAALTYEEFLEEAASGVYDAVYVATPNNTHRRYVEGAAALGKDALCEKPMAASVDGARSMVERCDAADVTLMIAYRMQTEPAVRRARDLVRAGALGELTQIHSHVSIDLLGINPDENQWKLDPEMGGGAMFGVGVYPLNTVEFVIDADPERVYANTWVTDDAFADVNEHVTFQLEFRDDVVALCSASHGGQLASNLRLVGTEGSINLEPIFHPWQTRQLTFHREETTATVQVEDVNQMVEEFEYFADRLLSDTSPAPDGREGCRDIEIMEAAHESAQSDIPVSTDGF